MKLTSIEIHPANSSNVCVLSFRDPSRQNPYNVVSVGGLDAETIVARYYPGTTPGTKYYDLSPEKREAVISIELNPRPSEQETYSSLRDNLYRMIASSRTGTLQLQFKNGDDVVAAVSGVVRKFETPHFETTPKITLTIECEDGMLRALDPVDVDVSGFDPELTTILDDLSTAHHGFKFEMLFPGTLTSFVMHDSLDTDWTFSVAPEGNFQGGDVLHYSSVYNDKYLYIMRGFAKIPIADAIVPGSVWPIMFPGENTFWFENWNSLEWQALSYYPTYWGV